MKFTKFRNRRRRKPLPPKCQYIPTLAELEYCKSMDITPSEYVNLKYERAKKGNNNV